MVILFFFKNPNGIPLSSHRLKQHVSLPFEMHFSEAFLTRKFTLYLKDLRLTYNNWQIKIPTVILQPNWFRSFSQKRFYFHSAKIFGGSVEEGTVPILNTLNAKVLYGEGLDAISLALFCKIGCENVVTLFTLPIPVKGLLRLLSNSPSKEKLKIGHLDFIKGINLSIRVSSRLETCIAFHSKEDCFFDPKFGKYTSAIGQVKTEDFNRWWVKGFLNGVQFWGGCSPRVSFEAQYDFGHKTFKNFRLGGIWEQSFVRNLSPVFYALIPNLEIGKSKQKIPFGTYGLSEPCLATSIDFKNTTRDTGIFNGQYSFSPMFLETIIGQNDIKGIRFQAPVNGYFTADSNLQKLKAKIFAKDFFHHEAFVKSMVGKLKCSKEKVVINVDELKTKDFSLNGKFKYIPSTSRGQLIVQGSLDPTCLYPYISILPKWWEAFWESFKFSQFPYGDTIVEFNAKDPNDFFCFGSVQAKNFLFNDVTHVEQFQLRFGSVPGYCWFFTPLLRTTSGRMQAEVGWPYSLKNERNEKWYIKGYSNVSLEDWSVILKFFGTENVDKILAILTQPKDCPKILFNGYIYGNEYSKKINAPLNITGDFDMTSVFYLPCKNLHISLRKWPDALFCDNFRFWLGDDGQGQGHFQIKGQDQLFFNFKFHKIQSKILFKNIQLLSDWFKDTQNSYDGLLFGHASGQGIIGNPRSFEIEGQANFKCKNLAQIHLFGPLSELLSKTPFALSSVRLDEALSDFHIKDLCLKSSNTQIMGPTTRVRGDGEINLENGDVDAHLRFSFLDYQRVKVPVVRHLLRIFQPISKGFEAKLSGSFQEPKWMVWFNPLRFLTP